MRITLTSVNGDRLDAIIDITDTKKLGEVMMKMSPAYLAIEAPPYNPNCGCAVCDAVRAHRRRRQMVIISKSNTTQHTED